MSKNNPGRRARPPQPAFASPDRPAPPATPEQIRKQKKAALAKVRADLAAAAQGHYGNCKAIVELQKEQTELGPCVEDTRSSDKNNLRNAVSFLIDALKAHDADVVAQIENLELGLHEIEQLPEEPVIVAPGSAAVN